MSLRPLSHVKFKKQQCRPVTNPQCRMSILANAHVAVLNLGVEGHNTGSDICVLFHSSIYDVRIKKKSANPTVCQIFEYVS